jgi:hypothetical protein
MPYHIESDNESCNGFAVVKDSDGEVMGCHRNEDQASRQMAALYAAEDDAEADDAEPTHTMPDGTVMLGASHPRAAGDPLAIVTDIDGTLLIGRDINLDLVKILNEADAAVLVVSAREPDQQKQTENRLADIGLEYDELFLVGGSNPTTAKVEKVNELLDRYDIVAAYENNETTRRAYTDIGIDARNPISNRFLAEQILARTTTIR